MTFRQAIEQTSSIAQAYRPGLQALRASDRGRVSANDPRLLSGSLDLDSTLSVAEPNSPRWDYGIGWKETSNSSERVLWVEIHPVRTKTHLSEIELKLNWLMQWLSGAGRRVGGIEREFVCVSSGETGFTSTSPQLRRFAARGLRFAGRHLRLR